MSAILGLNISSTARPVATTARQFSSSEKRIVIHPNRNSRLVFLTEPAGLAVERYRLLRRRLCTLYPHGGVVLITSPNPGEGKTLTSVNLAWAFAEAGHAACLVDLDFRAPGVSRALNCIFEEGGVKEVLEGKAEVNELIRRVSETSFHVLGIKERMTSPGHLLYSQALASMMANLRARFQWVVLDFAPVIPMADVSEVIAHVNGAILVVRNGKTEKDMLAPAIEAIGPKLWGVVANDCPINGSAYYGNYGKSPRLGQSK
ncbi:capsular exopolysaccharide synthesis family protein [Edaphobacter modestus]|uniref:Capsular exopolysaccharide synthesis family protein n=2 Tax=Edaphobacter modestus TaxID=388466 RepID=A0A4Q7YSK5_9BACT|nr:CpsD/CapB family tyrosine-protein kinase [Edaphobacter modestus]RZU39971.1 capsular exopolysaccharide synthesis family protein [Edaphobacter modestus]